MIIREREYNLRLDTDGLKTAPAGQARRWGQTEENDGRSQQTQNSGSSV